MSDDSIKAAIEAATGLSREALQLYAAILAQFACALLIRRGLAHPAPWLFALAVTAGEEWLEHSGSRLDPVDIGVAMIIPTLLMLAVRFAPGIVRPRGRIDSEV